MLARLKTLAQLSVSLCVLAIAAVMVTHGERSRVPQGWAGEEAVALSREFIGRQPDFAITDEAGQPVYQGDNDTKNVRLWEYVRAAAGETPAHAVQTWQDCTSFGTANAVEATAASQIVVGRQVAGWRRIFQPWIYGGARKWVLKGQLRGDGATGASVAQLAKEYGLLAVDDPGVPPYRGDLAREWGRTGPPEHFKPIAARHKVKTVARLKDAADCRDAVCNGYGCIVCSDWGAEGREAFRQENGRWVASRRGSWQHCMCIDGYDGSVPGKRYFHVLNSWPESIHPAPIDGSPVGGFWVEWDDVEYMTRDRMWRGQKIQGDCWAFSDFTGFPANAMPDLRLFGDKPPHVATTRKTVLSP